MFRQTQRSYFFGEWAVLCFSNCSDLFGSKNTVLEVRLFYQQLRWYSEVLRWWTRPRFGTLIKVQNGSGILGVQELMDDELSLIISCLKTGSDWDYNRINYVFLIFKLWVDFGFSPPFETNLYKVRVFFVWKLNGSLPIRFSGVQGGGDQGVALQGSNISPPLGKEKNPQKFLLVRGYVSCQEGCRWSSF